MTLKHLLAAASAAALIGGAAYAQDAGASPAPDDAAPTDATPAPDRSTPETLPSGVVNPVPDAAGAGADASTMAPAESPPDAMAPAAPSASESGTDVAAVVQPRILANAPIPDTPENRDKYGEPLSNAGKRSDPNGR